MDRKNSPTSLWQTARVETGTLGALVLGLILVNFLGWAPTMNSSLAALGVYAAWLALCVVIYRYFYRLDT